MSIWEEAELISQPKKDIWAEAELVQPTSIKKTQEKKVLPQYENAANNPTLTPEQKAKEIERIGKAERKAYDIEGLKNKARIGLGGVLQGASFHPVFNVPYVGTGIGGAMFDAGNAIVEGEKLPDIAKQAGRGFIIGETVGAIPYAGKAISKTKVGQAAINKAGNALKPLAENKTIQKIGKELTKERLLPKIGTKAQEIKQPKFVKEVKAEVVPEQVAQATPEQVVGDIKKRSLEQSVLEAKGTPKEVKEIIKKDMPTYNVLHNQDIIEQAQKEVSANFNDELVRLASAKDFSALDFEKSRQIAKQLFDNGDFEQAINLIDNVSENATKKGQAVQALSLWSNMTPEGAVYKAQKLVKEYNSKIPEHKQLKLTDEQIKNIRDLQTQALNSTDELSKNQAFARTAKYISELVPKNALQKLKAYRNISLLLNPKTLGRNIVGNALFNAIDTSSKALAVPFDRLIGKFTGKKTRVLPQSKEYLKGLIQGAKTGYKEAVEGIDTRGLGQRFDLTGGRTFETKPMQALETALDVGLRTPDRAFYEATFAESVENMMKAQGLTKPTQEILEQAEKEALEAVFQNQSKLSNSALSARNLFNNFGTKDFGLGDVLIPYAQTPTNLAQQGINYSPLGAIKGIANLTQGNQRQASLDFARSLLGTGLIGGGYGLSKAGIITPSQFDENYQKNKKIRENLQPLGIRPDQLGDIWYAPFQPMSIPLSVGNAIAFGKNPISSGINTVLDLPFMQSISKGLKDLQEGGLVQAGENFASSIPAQFTPTIGSQVAQVLDDYQRETYSPNKLQYGLNQAIAKVPFASQSLPIKYDVTGQPIERYSTEGLQKGFDIFLNPTYINSKKEDNVLSELKNLYDKTGETKQFLPSVDKKISFVDENGEKQKLELSGKQVSEYQRVLGQLNYQTINDLMQSPDYIQATEEEKIKMVNSRLSENNKLVKNKLFQIPLPRKKQNNNIEAKKQRLLSRRRSLQNKVYKNNLENVFNEIYFQE